MDFSSYVAPVASALSLIFFASTVFLLLERKKRDQSKNESYEVKDLLLDLARGGALVKITRIDPANVLLRSPRG